jgi:hypothetical protein
MKVTKTTKISDKWMNLRARHTSMGRTVLQLIANPDSTKSDIQAAAEMYREATTMLEAEYVKLSEEMKSKTYLPVLTHRGNVRSKVIIRHKPKAKAKV